MAYEERNLLNVADARLLVSEDLDAALPETATEAPGASFKEVGWFPAGEISEELTRTVNDLKVFQNNETVMSTVTDAGASVGVTFAEYTPLTLKTAFGAIVDTATGKYTINPGTLPGKRLFILDLIGSNGKKVRKWFIGQVTEIGSTAYNSDALSGIPCTITIYGGLHAIDPNMIAVAA